MTTDPPAFTWPLPGHYEVSSGFDDPRWYGPHNAIDVPAPSGTPYRALAAGRVAFAGRFGSCGLTVQIDHANGWRSHVCHLSALHVTTGHNVAQGQFIGDVGSTGDSTGPHAHTNLFAPTPVPGSRYVPWVTKFAVDPLIYLTKEDEMTVAPHYHTNKGVFFLIGLTRGELSGPAHDAAHDLGSEHALGHTIAQLDDFAEATANAVERRK